LKRALNVAVFAWIREDENESAIGICEGDVFDARQR
jgi:hypothetical protein